MPVVRIMALSSLAAILALFSLSSQAIKHPIRGTLGLLPQQALLDLRTGGLRELRAVIEIARDLERGEVLSAKIPDLFGRDSFRRRRGLKHYAGLDLFLTDRIRH